VGPRELSDERSAAIAFAEFYASNYQWCARLAYLMTGSSIASDDLAQEAFLAVQPRFAELAEPAAYLRVTIVRRCVDHARREQRRAALARNWYPELIAEPVDRELADVLAKLPAAQRSVIVLRYWLGMTTREISSTIDTREGTVKTWLRRGLKDLARQLKEVDP
jgi:RNA polymerase sigma factor (sigma-70 family)